MRPSESTVRAYLKCDEFPQSRFSGGDDTVSALPQSFGGSGAFGHWPAFGQEVKTAASLAGAAALFLCLPRARAASNR